MQAAAFDMPETGLPQAGPVSAVLRPEQPEFPGADGATLKQLMGMAEESILREYRRRFKSTRKLARALGISQPSVVRKLHQYGIDDADG